MSRNEVYIVMLSVITLGSVGCKSNREVQGDRVIPSRKTEEVLSLMRESEIQCDWVSLKYDVEIESEKFEDSFKMYVRLKQDSVIWVSATYYAVEVARFLFTPDTVKFMDRKNNQYYIGDYSYIHERFKIAASFEVLESLILSNSVKLLQMQADADKIRTSKDEGKYHLSFLNKGQIRRALKRDDEDLERNLNVGLWVNPDGFRLARTSIEDFDTDRILTAEYSEYQAACNSQFPYITEYMAESENEQAKVKTSVMKMSSGKKVSLSFTIPDKYEALVP